MAVKLAFNRVEQFCDGNGLPYSGAKLFTYTAGSTTKQTTYTESTGTTPNTNPIVLDSAGRLPQPVWLTTGVSYKFVLAPSTDTDPPASPISSLDNISGINDTAVSAANEWIAGPTPTFVSATSFTMAGDQTSAFAVGRRLKTTNTAGSIYSTITASVFGALTTVTVVNDSGALDSGLSATNYGILQASNQSIPWLKAALNLAGGLSPSQITSTQNDYNPSGLATTNTLRINSDAARSITGLQGGTDGRVIAVHNTGSFGITLTRQDAGSSAANRFAIDANITIAADQSVLLRYDVTTARWRHVQYSDGEYRSVQVFTAGGTYTAPAGLKRAKVIVVGGGGAGGGSPATGGAQVSGGASGAAGGIGIRTLTAAQIGASQTVTIAAAATGNSGAAGSNGGTCSFGALVTATGGTGGAVAGPAAAITPSGLSGGTGGSGDINIPGAPGSMTMATNAGGFYITATGASGPYGAGGIGPQVGQAGGAANGYGAGGSGTVQGASGAAVTGGAATAGIVIVEEFF